MSIQQWDEKILLALNDLLGENEVFDFLIEAMAVYSIYVVPVALIVLWFRKVREVGIRAALAGLFYWLVVTPLIAEAWFRPRPPLAELGGREFIFHRPTYSFPSDHAGFLAAFTVTFYLNGYRKIAAAFFVLTIVISFARIIVGFHYPTDILAGWLIGSAVAYAVHYGREWIDRYVGRSVIKLAQRIKLA
jgi:undecaprenyl-diphosphatase